VTAVPLTPNFPWHLGLANHSVFHKCNHHVWWRTDVYTFM